MLPTLDIGVISMYYLSMLTGIVVGWILFVADEFSGFPQKSAAARAGIFLKTTLAYLVIVALCIQGANWFHFFFDNIPEKIRQSLTAKDILLAHPFRTIKVLYGAIFLYPAGIFLVTLFSRSNSFLQYLSQKAFVLFLILAFTRVGCFCNGCCYGIVSDRFGLVFPRGSAASIEHFRRGYTRGFVAPPSLPVIPTQLISALVLFLISWMAWWSYRRTRSRTVFFTAVFWYSVFRFLIEFFRDDVDRAYWYHMSASQWIALFVFACFAAWHLVIKRSASS